MNSSVKTVIGSALLTAFILTLLVASLAYLNGWTLRAQASPQSAALLEVTPSPAAGALEDGPSQPESATAGTLAVASDERLTLEEAAAMVEEAVAAQQAADAAVIAEYERALQEYQAQLAEAYQALEEAYRQIELLQQTAPTSFVQPSYGQAPYGEAYDDDDREEFEDEWEFDEFWEHDDD